jgi:hypothetical protein
MNPDFIPCQFFAILAYEQLGMEEDVRKKFEILAKITGDAKKQPAITPWTDKGLAEQQEELWHRIVSRYS